MGASAQPPLPPARVEVFRVGSGQTVYVRTLSPSYDGCMTHWMRPSQYHDPDEPCEHCRKSRCLTYKGYFASQVWDELRELWLPAVFELTEASELDVRGRYERGQEWKFTRLPDSTKKGRTKHFPVVGQLVTNLSTENLPESFSVLPVLRTMYHAPTLRLGIENPMAARVFADPTAASPPSELLAKKEPGRMPKEQHAAMRQQMRLQGWVPPEERKVEKNGKH